MLRFHDSETAFQGAIEDGYLSEDPTSERYAGDYMYMGTFEGRDLFKNIRTRRYLYVPCTWLA